MTKSVVERCGNGRMKEEEEVWVRVLEYYSSCTFRACGFEALDALKGNKVASRSKSDIRDRRL